MYYGIRHPAHDGAFVRDKGNWHLYHQWCCDNGYAKMVHGEVVFILKPIASIKKQGRNDKCACGSNKKFKKCCMRKI